MRRKKNIKLTKGKSIVIGILTLVLVLLFFLAPQFEPFFVDKKGIGKNEVNSKKLSNSNYEVTYLDIGQGNATFVSFPDGKTALIDCGNVYYGERVAKFLTDKNISQIDYLIATHADSDHIGGFNYVLEHFEIKNIFRPFQISGTGTSIDTFVPNVDEDLSSVYMEYKNRGDNSLSRVTSQVYKDFISNIYSETYIENNIIKNSSVTVFYDGLKISGNDYEIEFFAPFVNNENYVDFSLRENSKSSGFATFGYKNSNDNSSIFLMSIEDEKFFFSGDATYTNKNNTRSNYEEQDFILSLTQTEKQNLMNVDVFMVGHHGSKYSSSKELLDILCPRFSIVSAGKDNTYGHPHQEVLTRLNNATGKESDYLLMTLEKGNISFGVVENELKYCCQKAENRDTFIISWCVSITAIYVLLVTFVVNINVEKNNRKVD